MALNAKQQRFVDEYLIDLNATQAAVRAGYSAKTAKQIGSRLLTHVDVAAAVTERQQERSEVSELSEAWILERLKENVDRAMQATEVKDREGNGTGEYIYQGAVANKALELIGKHRGMFIERREVTGRNGGPVEVKVRIVREGKRVA